MSDLEEILIDQIEAERRERIAEGEAQKAPDEEAQATAFDEREVLIVGDLPDDVIADIEAAEYNRRRSIENALTKVQEENAARAKNHAESKCTQILESIRVALEENEDPDEALEIVKEALGL